jgi:hypothetical protein
MPQQPERSSFVLSHSLHLHTHVILRFAPQLPPARATRCHSVSRERQMKVGQAKAKRGRPARGNTTHTAQPSIVARQYMRPCCLHSLRTVTGTLICVCVSFGSTVAEREPASREGKRQR